MLNRIISNALKLATDFDYVAIYSSGGHEYESTSIQSKLSDYKCLIAFGDSNCETSKSLDRKQLQTWLEKEWSFGFLDYDFGPERDIFEQRSPEGFEGWPDQWFFRPQHLISFSDDKLKLEFGDTELLELLKKDAKSNTALNHSIENINWVSSESREHYLVKVDQIKKEIIKGNVYELNYCFEFTASSIINPYASFQKMHEETSGLMSGFLKMNDRFILSSSMERFLKKIGKKLFAQPIKGTIARGKNEIEDQKQSNALLESEKERAENVMIVDLMRNDLAKTAIANSVEVDELFGIYPFPQVHQMISTVSSTLNETYNSLDAILAAYPMGSMTGAPKPSAIKLISRFENLRRGAYSGSLGYFKPDGDFDLNVLIRSVLYDHSNQRLRLPVGSAITYDAKAEAEYEECLLKVSKIRSLIC